MAAALGQEPDRARLELKVRLEGDPALGIVQPHTVGPHHPDAGFPGPPAELSLELRVVLAAGLAEAGGEEMDELDLLGFRPFHHFQGRGGRNGGDNEINGPRYLLEPGVRLEPQELAQFGVHRVHGAGEAELNKPLHELVSLASFVR